MFIVGRSQMFSGWNGTALAAADVLAVESALRPFLAFLNTFAACERLDLESKQIIR